MNIVRPNGTLIEGYTYDEFGNKTQTEYDSAGNEITNPSNEIFENEVTFTSSITDTSTGLQYMNARYYEPTTGRFISQDTYTGNAYDPWTQHLYSYCGNNPVNMIDPTGHKATSADLYKQSSKLFAAARTLKKTSYALLDTYVDCYKMGLFNLGDRMLEASDTIYKQSRYIRRLASSTLKMADALKAKEDEAAREQSSNSTPAFGSTHTVIDGSSTTIPPDIYFVGFSQTHSSGTVSQEGESGWFASVGSYEDKTISATDFSPQYGVTAKLFDFVGVDLHWSYLIDVGADITLDFGDTTVTIIGADISKTAAIHGGLTKEADGKYETDVTSLEIGPMGILSAIIIAATGGAAAPVLAF